jgi:biopolymer transport protein ExbB
MIKAFYNISIADNISIGIIAGGIYEKMVTSASGLVVGIIAFVFYTILNSKIDKAVSNIEIVTTEFLDTLYKPSV